MKIALFCFVLFGLLFSGCEALKSDQEFSTLPSTNNPNLIIDSNRGARGF